MTPDIKRRDPSGVVWVRVDKELGENISRGRMVQPGDLHWCGESPQPERATVDTPPHRCMIWQKSEDQDWQPPEPVISQDNPIDSLIEKLKTTAGDVESIPVLAMLYQAKALERIAELLETVTQNRGGSTPLQTQAVGSGLGSSPEGDSVFGSIRPFLCFYCCKGEHPNCDTGSGDIDCECPDCHLPPPIPYAHIHRFQGMEDNSFCTQCGGGRLHPIHQTA